MEQGKFYAPEPERLGPDPRAGHQIQIGNSSDATTLKCNETFSESLIAPCPPEVSLNVKKAMKAGDISGVAHSNLPFSIANVALKNCNQKVTSEQLKKMGQLFASSSDHAVPVTSVSSALFQKGGPKYTVHLNTSKGQTVVQLPQNTSNSSSGVPKTTSTSSSAPRQPGAAANLLPGLPFPTSYATSQRLYSGPGGGAGVRPAPITLPPSYNLQSSYQGLGGLTTSSLANFSLGFRGASMLLPVPSSLHYSSGPTLKSPGGPAASGLIFPGPNPAPSPVTPTGSGATPGGGTTPGPSPRPGILRKRPAPGPEVASTSSPGAVRKLVYEPSHLELGKSGNNGKCLGQTTSGGETPMETGAEVTISGRTESPPPVGGRESVTSEEASNQSTASTASSSRPDSSSLPPRSPELSPRKRPRKQKFDDVISAAAAAKKLSMPRSKSVLAACNHSASTQSNKRPLSSNGRMMLLESVKSEPAEGNDRLCNGGQARPPSARTPESTGTGSTTTERSEEEEEEEEISDEEDDASRNSISPVIVCSPVKRFVALPHRAGGEGTSSDPPAEFRPRPSLLASYDLAWHPRKDHFRRPESVKFVEKLPERKRRSQLSDPKFAHQTVCKLVNDKETTKKLSPWKVRLIQKQLRTMLSLEWDNFTEVTGWLERYRNFANIHEHFDFRSELDNNSRLEGWSVEESRELEGIHEMALTMAQRNKAAAEQMDEISGSLGMAVQLNGTDIGELLERFASKRPVRGRKFSRLDPLS